MDLQKVYMGYRLFMRTFEGQVIKLLGNDVIRI